MNQKEQLDTLTAFAYDVLELLAQKPNKEIEAIATKHGLISLQTVPRPCGPWCTCTKTYPAKTFEAGGVRCNVVADWLWEWGETPA